MKTRFAILVGLTLTAPPVWGMSWLEVKAYFLGPLRGELMTACDTGRQYNAYGTSYWDSARSERRRTAMLSNGHDSSSIQAFFAGQTAAMAEVCPDVR